jgi:hypothetical protein
MSASHARRTPADAALHRLELSLGPRRMRRMRARRLRSVPRGHSMMIIADADGSVSIHRAPARGAFLERVVDAVSNAYAHLRPGVETPFSDRERALLKKGGVRLGSRGVDPVLRSAGRYAEILAGSLPVQEAAKRLGVNPSRIRQRLIARTLYGVKMDSEWLLPEFQFHEGREVPGLRLVLPHLPADGSPVGVRNWLTTASADLDDLSPLQWLLTGRPAATLIELLRNPALP